NSPVAAIHNEEAPIVADLNTVNRIELVGSGILRIFRRVAPVHQKLSILIELRDASAAVPVADKECAVGQPRDIGRTIKELAAVTSSLAFCAERHHQLSIVSELVDHV